MQFSIFAILAAAAAVVSADSGTVAYDTTYDTSSLSTLSLACSDGTNGLNTKGYSTLGSLPGYPNVGAAVAVTGWNSAACGTCWAITYGSTTINALAVDVSTTGWVLSKAAMDTLTGGQAAALGRVSATWSQVDASACGM